MALDTQFVYQPPQQALRMVYQDHDYIAIDKPAGLLSVMGRLPEHQDSAYLRILKLYPTAKVTHRLDMATSGILLFAKHRAAEVAMSKLFQARAVQKCYTALVEGLLPQQGSVDVPLITDWENRPKQKVDFEIGKSAMTLYQLLSHNSAQGTSRVLLSPITGRSHQLRVHMAHIGHPILGDKIYHPQPQLSPIPRMALHAHLLAFTQPFSGQHIVIESAVSF